MSVEGMRFVITGAGKGIGAGTARLAADRGAKVAIADIDEDAGGRVAEEIRQSGGTAAYFRCDVAAESDVRELMGAAAAALGGIDVLHNNAGVQDMQIVPDPSLEAMSLHDYLRIIHVDLIGPWLCAKYAVPYLRRSGNPSIINAGSVASLVAYPGNLAYGAAKGGVVLLTKNLALELARDGIRVNCYCPAVVDTDMINQLANQSGDRDGFLRAVTASHLVRRLGQPEDVARLVCFLASEEASFINGAVVKIDGGSLAWRGTVDVIGLD